MERHRHDSSRDPDQHSWTRLSGSEPSQHPEWEFLSFPTPPSSTPTSTPQSLSNLLQPTFRPCETKTSLPTFTVVELSDPLSSTTSPSPPTSTPTLIHTSLQPKPLANLPQTIITSTSPGKVIFASFSTTSTSTITQIITISSPSQSPPSSIRPPANLPSTPNHQSTSLTRLSTDSKVGLLLTLSLFILLLLALAILFFTRGKRRARLLAAQRLLAVPHYEHNSYAYETQPLTASTPETYAGIEVFEAGEPRTSLDSAGVRWPEKVVLAGDAKEVREWTEEYEGRRGEEGYERRVLESYGFSRSAQGE